MKHLLTLILIILASILPASAQQPTAQGGDEADRAITELREGLTSSFQKGDIDTLLTFLSPEVIVTWQNAEVCRGTEAVRAFHTRMMSGNQRVVREIRSAPEILGRQVLGDVALSWGNLHDRFILMDGTDLPLDSVFTASTAKRGNRWVVTSFHVSVNAFANPVLAMGIKKVALWVGIAAGGLGVLAGFIAARRHRKA